MMALRTGDPGVHTGCGDNETGAAMPQTRSTHVARHGRTIAIVAAVALIALSVVGVAYGASKVAPAAPSGGPSAAANADGACPQAATGCETQGASGECPNGVAGAASGSETQCPNAADGSDAAGAAGCSGGCGSAGATTSGASY